MSLSPPAKPTHDVVVVGSIMQDLSFTCDRFPSSGQTIVAQLRVGQGGKGSNQAIASGRAGARSIFIGAVGDGSFAREALAFYQKDKIACRLVPKRGCATGTAVILLNRAGENEIVIEPGANARLSAADVPPALIRRAKIVVTQLESNLATTARVLQIARRAGVPTILNPAPMRKDFKPPLLRHVDILVPNESEFLALAELLSPSRRPPATVDELRAMPGEELHSLCRDFKIPTVIVTLGDRGCFVSEPQGHRFIPAHTGLAVVDTTGAGDAFCGGFAAGFVRTGGDVIAAAHFGNAVAALSITKPGAASSMPRPSEIRRFMGRVSSAGKRIAGLR